MSTIINENDRDDRNEATSDRYANDTRNSRLSFLDDLSGYKVHHDDIDPRGYNVKLTDGQRIGEVEGLLADTKASLVRYVEIEFDEDVIGRHQGNLYSDEHRHALIPVGLIHIDKSNNTVTVGGVDNTQIVDYPRFRKTDGYSTRYEIDTNDYLAGFHEYGTSYDRNRFSTQEFRRAEHLDDDFYSSDFYSTRASRSKI